MINPTIETDLVGEIIEVRDVRYSENSNVQRRGRGRCRAVTVGKDGAMMLWLEVLTEDDRWAYWFIDPKPAIGDIICVTTESQNYGQCTLHLMGPKG